VCRPHYCQAAVSRIVAGQTDEAEMGVTYELIDNYLEGTTHSAEDQS
jgi:NH3-dependent NAD+ synthetase